MDRTMLRSSRLLVLLGLATALVVSRPAPAAVWSIEADCRRGDWSVDVELAGFGLVDASCRDGRETRLSVDVGEQNVTGGQVAAISSLGTLCESAEASAVKLALKCGDETEDATGFEVEEELEVEVELSEPDEAEPIGDE